MKFKYEHEVKRLSDEVLFVEADKLSLAAGKRNRRRLKREEEFGWPVRSFLDGHRQNPLFPFCASQTVLRVFPLFRAHGNKSLRSPTFRERAGWESMHRHARLRSEREEDEAEAARQAAVDQQARSLLNRRACAHSFNRMRFGTFWGENMRKKTA